MEDYYLKLKKQSNELFKVSIAAIILHLIMSGLFK